MEENYEIGKVVNTFGIKGEVKIYPYVDYFDKINSFFIDNKEMKIEKIRNNKNVIIAKIVGIDDINDAENLKGKIITISEKNLPKLPKGVYYKKDLINLDVITDEGKELRKNNRCL